MLETTNAKNSVSEHSCHRDGRASTVAVSPLFSGSKGNCTLIQCGNVNILLDAGFSYKAILRALSERGLTQKDIDAIIITHEHTDHIAALPYWGKSCSTPIYAPAPIADYLRQRVYFCEVHEICGSFDIGGMTVDVYECSHDARSCCGYRFSNGNGYFACVTDTGCYDDRLIEFLSPCGAIMLESNHDLNMLVKGEYSYVLKQRILSPYGHLSNVQAAEVVQKLAHSRVKTIILAHLSEKNNTKELAFNATVAALSSCGLVEGRDVTVYVADQYKNEVTVCVD
ncbi:MAG: MBL fold metallo-hydrolase [Clostridiales bacterium]|nr:MBL fold metallo-hydrolase [Clostridiales bacterium]